MTREPENKEKAAVAEGFTEALENSNTEGVEKEKSEADQKQAASRMQETLRSLGQS